MTGSQDKPAPDFEAKAAPLDRRLEMIANLASDIVKGQNILSELIKDIRVDSESKKTEFKEEINKTMAMLERVISDQDKIRGVLFSKMDGLQGTMDLVREDTRNAWGTADSAISNSRHMREDTDKMLNMMSVMQKQQQLLTSQVEELRKKAAEKEEGL